MQIFDHPNMENVQTIFDILGQTVQPKLGKYFGLWAYVRPSLQREKGKKKRGKKKKTITLSGIRTLVV